MADFERTLTGDIKVAGGDFVLIDGPAAIRQDIEFRLRVGLGECVYDTSAGTPWLQVLFLDGTTDESRRFILRQIILNTPGVIELGDLDFSLDRQTRVLTISGTAQTIEGEVIFNLDGSAK